MEPIKPVGVPSFIDIVKAHAVMDSSQDHACKHLVQELLVTKFGMHVAAELKSKGIKPAHRWLADSHQGSFSVSTRFRLRESAF